MGENVIKRGDWRRNERRKREEKAMIENKEKRTRIRIKEEGERMCQGENRTLRRIEKEKNNGRGIGSSEVRDRDG